MYVCICSGVTDGQIRAAVRDGARTMTDLRASLGVATQCGRCARCARQVVRDARRETPTRGDMLPQPV